jgi:hypothetical protein
MPNNARKYESIYISLIEDNAALVASPNPSTDILALNTEKLGVIPIHVDIYVSNGQLVKSFGILV